ncbi:MAG: AI-2E family transporter [Bacteroidales bacterium]|nr:AI-2E family transporter [Bacteroidales bacterium]
MDHLKKIYVLLIVIVAVIVLIYAQSIIIPFVLAVLFWFMIRVIKKLITRIRFIGKWPGWLLSTISAISLLAILGLVVELISNNIQHLSETLPLYESNVSSIADSLNSIFNIDIYSLLKEYTNEFNFAGFLTSLFSALTGLFGNVFIIILYVVFLLIEEPIFSSKLKAMYPDKERYNNVNEMISKIDSSINHYIALKTLVSLLTGFLSYFALLFIGVDAPMFWAFLIFLLNFIPTIGSLIATFFPAAFALLQFGEISPAILVIAIVGTIQIIVGNLIEPRLMGNTLNISPLVVFLTLTLWGVMWGVTGMLLSVPITVMLIIILSEFPGTRPLAILLSHRGILSK